MWFELKFTCSLTDRVSQYNQLVGQGYTAMMCSDGTDGTVFVNDNGHRTGLMLALRTTSCTITEHKDFTSLLAQRNISN